MKYKRTLGTVRAAVLFNTHSLRVLLDKCRDMTPSSTAEDVFTSAAGVGGRDGERGGGSCFSNVSSGRCDFLIVIIWTALIIETIFRRGGLP
jgi:hypothetical protein